MKVLPAGTAVVVLQAPPESIVLPDECACCGEPAVKSMAERRGWAQTSVLVPYCAACHRHASAAVTAELSLLWATALVALTATFCIPLLIGPPSRLTVALFVLAASAMPSLLFLALERSAPRGHVTAGRAARFRMGALVFRNPGFGRKAVEASSASGVERMLPSRELPLAAPLLCAAGALGSVGFVDLLFPVVHVVTAGSESLTLTVDGKDRGDVRPSGSEYASSLREIRVLVGPRRFAARSVDGRERDPVTFDVRPGRDYLYAPDSRGTCFRVEAAGYGRSTTPVTVEPLDPSRAFWEIEPRLDLWLSPLPAPSPDTRSSGGTARALRRSPCGKSDEPTPTEMRSPAGFETPDE